MPSQNIHRTLSKEGPWAEHLTLGSDRGWDIRDITVIVYSEKQEYTMTAFCRHSGQAAGRVIRDHNYRLSMASAHAAYRSFLVDLYMIVAK